MVVKSENATLDFVEHLENVDRSYDLSIPAQAGSGPLADKMKLMLEKRRKRQEAKATFEKKTAAEVEAAAKNLEATAMEVEEEEDKDSPQKGPEDPEPPYQQCVLQNRALPAVSLPYGSELLVLQRWWLVAEGATPESLKTLYDMVVGESAVPLQAAQLMMEYYEEQGVAACWVPSLADMWSSMQELGCSDSQASDRAARGGRTRAADPTSPNAAQHTQDAPSPDQIRHLQALLRLLSRLCQLARQGRLVLEAGTAVQAAVRSLLVVLAQLQLDPSAAQWLLLDIQEAYEELVVVVDEVVWSRVVGPVSEALVALGPSYRAGLVAIAGLPGHSLRKKVLQQQAALGLLAVIKPTLKEQAAGRGAANRRGGGAEVAADLTDLVRVFGQSPPSALNQLASSQELKKGRPLPDYWKLVTMVQAGHIVIWNQLHGRDDVTEEDLRFLRWWTDYLRVLSRKLQGGSTNLGASRLKSLISDLHTRYLTSFGAE